MTFIIEPSELLRISKDGIWVNPDVPVDEAAQKVLSALDQNIKIIIDRAVQDSKRELVGLTDEEIGEIKQTSPIYVSAKAVNAIVPMVEAKLKEKNA